jgi:aspartyl-tRNA(Asn)/glutamyl-tRNA(Gln) amidotransferase subunit A
VKGFAVMADETAFLSIAEAAQRLRSGALSPVELVEANLARIDAHDARLSAWLHVDRAGALAAAEAALQELRAGRNASPLLGAPIGIKDLFDVAAMPTTWNSRLPREPRAAADAAVAASLRANGAILLGKLAAWECGVGGVSFTLPWPDRRVARPRRSRLGCALARWAPTQEDPSGSLRRGAASLD